jgi:glycogen debranching enzyme
LLDAFGQKGAAGKLRSWAAQLAEHFHQRFWVEDADGPYPALALDGDKRPVDSLTSNIGHLLGTGLLDEKQSALIVDRLTAPGLDGGFGLRTMDRREGGYSLLSHHCGSVWPHDTAIAIWSMARAGYGHRAVGLVDGLLAAADRFDYRLPELYSGDGRDGGPNPGMVPYPAACRPQAWAAAAVGAIVQCLLGLHMDVPGGEVVVAPIGGGASDGDGAGGGNRFGALRVNGLAAGGARFGVEAAGNGATRLLGAPAWVRSERQHTAQA